MSGNSNEENNSQLPHADENEVQNPAKTDQDNNNDVSLVNQLQNGELVSPKSNLDEVCSPRTECAKSDTSDRPSGYIPNSESNICSGKSGNIGPSNSRPLGKHHLTLFGAFAVQFVALIGAGILFYPRLFADLGYVLAMIFMIVIGSVCGAMEILLYYTIQKLKNLHPGKKIETLEVIMKLTFGRWPGRFAAFTYIATNYLIAVAYMILIGDLMVGFADIGGGATVANVPVSQFYWTLIFGVLQLLLAYLPNLKAIQHILNAGLVSIFVLFVTQIVLCAKAISDDVIGNTPGVEGTRAVAIFPESQIEAWKVVLGGATAFVFGFGSLVVCGQVIEDMGPNHKDFPKSVVLAIGVVMAMYTVFGCLGYAAFGSASPTAFLSPDSLIADQYYTYWAIAAVCTLININVSIPIFLNTMYRGVERIVLTKAQRNKFLPEYLVRTFSVLAVLAVSCTPIAWFADLTGLLPMCTTATISLIFPVLFYAGTLEHEYADENNVKQHSTWKACAKKYWWQLIVGAVIILFAVVFIVFGFWTALESLINNIKGDSDEPTLDNLQGFAAEDGTGTFENGTGVPQESF